MTKLQEIEKSLVSINDAVFQNVCDSILYHTQENYPDIVRTGSTAGKQKTSKGTPDTYFILPNGRYLFVEYTTKEKSESKASFLKKAKDDIAKCLNEEKTGVKYSELEKIIFCFNSKLTTKEAQSLRKLCAQFRISLELKGIDTIAFNLIGSCKHVAKEFLNITIDSGQILTPKVFIEEYEISNFATPLSNKLYGRDKELIALIDSIKKNQITIVAGAPGVGKSRLVLEALSKLQVSNKRLTVLCLSNKSAPIHDDLRVYLAEDKPYIVFIDDGNRQSNNLQTLLGLLRERRKNKIQIVITVRDYALNGIKSECINYRAADFELTKLSDEQIIYILKGDDFQISGFQWLQRITDISNGNPRLAIMAARVAIETQTLSSLQDVYTLYEQYFDGAISDRSVLSDKMLLKSIGILSFFYSVNLEDRDFVEKLCRNFSIDHYEFKQALIKFVDWELAEISPDNNVVRISEQVLATYLFYKTFLKDGILDFDIILQNYFHSHVHRFNDTVIGANSTFGYTNVLGAIDPYLTKYWQSVKEDQTIAIKFLKLFWLYRHEDIYEYADCINKGLQDALNPSYIYSEDIKNKGYHNKDEILDLLSNCFQYRDFDYLDALELSFEYVRKKPEYFQQLIGSIIENFTVDIEDLANKCDRQKSLFSYLLDNLNSNEIFLESLFHLLPTFLNKAYRSSRVDKINSGISVNQKIQIVPAISDFRKEVWIFIINNYQTYKSRFEDVLWAYTNNGAHEVKVILEFDFRFLAKLFRSHFKKSSLADVFIIQSLLYNFKRLDIHPKGIERLKSSFLSNDYKTYLALSFNRLRDKEDFDFINYDEYQRLKEEEIRSFFNFNTVLEFKNFYRKYVEISLLKDKSHSQISTSLDIIIHDHYLRDPDLAYSFLKEIIISNNVTNFNPIRVLKTLFATQNKLIAEYYEVIKNSSFKSKEWWLWYYYHQMPEHNVTPQFASDFLSFLQTTTSGIYIEFSVFEKFAKIKKRFFIDALILLIANKEKSGKNVQIDHFFFDNFQKHYLKRLDLLKQIYVLCDNDKNHFDHDCKHLFGLVKLDNSFLLEYFKSLKKEDFPRYAREFDHLAIIWSLNNAEVLIEEVLNYFSLTDKYFTEDLINSFFKNIDTKQTNRTILFLKSYLKANINNSNVCNLIFGCVRNTFKENWPDFILYYLALEDNFEKFREVELLNSFFSSTGKVIWADIRAKDLQRILETIDTIKTKKYRYNKHRNYIKDWILAEKRHADYERKMQFQHKHWH